ncbi:BlaI/MecI/CopY family transcriptional regulator [Microbacterium sp.]|uniref:BlaI/MecI/CopY family transcriptional regulator n=1 Tax=Microbacterium sp. TaxID=51671 RepID=UPI003A89C335
MAGIRTRERGELEGEVLRLLRAHDGSLSAQELRELFTGHVPAYTTLMTALTRLEKKGDVIRSGDSPRKVRFRAARSAEAQASDTMLSALHTATDRHAALLAFTGNLDDDDLALLRSAFGPTGKKR